MTDEQKREEIAKLLAATYTPEGITLWLAHAEKQGWTLDEQLQRADQLASGAFV